MPEIPDLAVMAKNLEKRLVNHTVKDVVLHISKNANATENGFYGALVNHKIKSICREGKDLHLEIGDHILALRLMLHGELRLVVAEFPKFPIFELDFGGMRLCLTDFQSQARPILNPDPVVVPDALDVSFTFFHQMLERKKSDIKTVLTDQKNIRGIGNAYADEILYDAGIAPHSIANKVPAEKLFKSMQTVLIQAIERIGMSDPDRITGENRSFMKVHLPDKLQTPKGETILIDKKGTRKSYYVKSQSVYK